MNLNQFEYLLTVYQEKSITKAAQKLFVSAPAISTAVKQMEEELGYSILIRQPNGINNLTDFDIFPALNSLHQFVSL